MADFSTKVLGVARIRQKRVLQGNCIAADFSHSLLNITRCKPELTTKTADKKSSGGKLTMWTYVQPLEAGVTITYGLQFFYMRTFFKSPLTVYPYNTIIIHLFLSKSIYYCCDISNGRW